MKIIMYLITALLSAEYKYTSLITINSKQIEEIVSALNFEHCYLISIRLKQLLYILFLLI